LGTKVLGKWKKGIHKNIFTWNYFSAST